MVIISHDQEFLNKMGTRMFWLNHGKLRKRDGEYRGFFEWSEELIEIEKSQIHKIKQKVKSETKWSIEGISGRRKRNMGRMRELEKLNEDYSINETVTVTDGSINLYTNSILTMNTESVNAFWSESASGKIYTFNTETKVIEEFAAPINDGIAFNTVVKQHPKTKQVYVAGLEGFIDPDNTVLVIYNADKTVAKTIQKVGASPIDIYFSDKEFTN